MASIASASGCGIDTTVGSSASALLSVACPDGVLGVESGEISRLADASYRWFVKTGRPEVALVGMLRDVPRALMQRVSCHQRCAPGHLVLLSPSCETRRRRHAPGTLAMVIPARTGIQRPHVSCAKQSAFLAKQSFWRAGRWQLTICQRSTSPASSTKAMACSPLALAEMSIGLTTASTTPAAALSACAASAPLRSL